MKWRILPVREFDELADEWGAINGRGADTPLLDPLFVGHLLHYFGSGLERLGVCEVDGRACAMAIIENSRIGTWTTFQPSQAPIGMFVAESDLSLPDAYHSLAGAVPGLRMVLGSSQLDPAILPRPESSPRINTLDYIRTARIPIEGSFEDY